MACRTLSTALVAMLVQSAWSQQLKDAAPAFMGYPGISVACETALNTTVDCPSFLASISVSNEVLDSERVDALCSGSCATDLQSVRTRIANACKATSDVIVFDNIAYPATFIADHYLLTSQVSCYKDRSTGDYCDPQFLSWSGQGIWADNQTCSDCWLGVQAVQLGNPIGFDRDWASDFAALKSSCSVNGYAYATPTAYGINATATGIGNPTFTPPSTCTGSYTLRSGDDCGSVAKKLGVSTHSLLYANGLDLACETFDANVDQGIKLCIPPTCKTYTWGAFDSCNDVARQQGISVAHFLSWNPNFDAICRNTITFAGHEVCVSTPGGNIDSGSSLNLSVSTGASTAVPAPTNSFPETRECGGWYLVRAGDNCGSLAFSHSITLADFYFLNPEVNSECTNLLLDVSYCVFPVGNIATYSGYQPPPTLSITVPPVTFSSVNTAIPSPTFGVFPEYVYQNLPRASGTPADCYSYAEYNDNATDSSHNACSWVTSAYDVALSDLLAWNPSLSGDTANCALQPGLSYCVQKSNVTLHASTDSKCVQAEASQIPDGTDARCVCFTGYSGYDGIGGVDCASVAQDAKIKVSQLVAWNSWLQSDCDTNLSAGMEENDWRAVCIGINATAPTASATRPPPTASIPTQTKTSMSMGPTQTGIVSGCQQYYTIQLGDSCAAIQAIYAISFADLYSWNPSIGSDCQNLWLGYAYCVSGPISATTSGVAPAAPTQSGITAKCNSYYTVQSGDGCWSIGNQYGVMTEQLFQWNPSIGSDCANLWLDYAICVGVSSS